MCGADAYAFAATLAPPAGWVVTIGHGREGCAQTGAKVEVYYVPTHNTSATQTGDAAASTNVRHEPQRDSTCTKPNLMGLQLLLLTSVNINEAGWESGGGYTVGGILIRESTAPARKAERLSAPKGITDRKRWGCILQQSVCAGGTPAPAERARATVPKSRSRRLSSRHADTLPACTLWAHHMDLLNRR